jgi:hypothetical protein
MTSSFNRIGEKVIGDGLGLATQMELDAILKKSDGRFYLVEDEKRLAVETHDSPRIQRVIDKAKENKVNVVQFDAKEYDIKTTIVGYTGLALVGAWYGARSADASGTRWKRTADVVAFKSEGGSVSKGLENNRSMLFVNIRCNGGDFTSDFMQLYATALVIMDSFMITACGGRELYCHEVMDSRIENCIFEWGGNASGSLPMIEFASGGEYEYTNQVHLIGVRCETYRGTAIATTGTNTNEIFMQNVKLESLISNVKHASFSNATAIHLDALNICSKGTPGSTLSEQIEFINCNAVIGSLYLEHTGTIDLTTPSNNTAANINRYVSIKGTSQNMTLNVKIYNANGTKTNSPNPVMVEKTAHRIYVYGEMNGSFKNICNRVAETGEINVQQYGADPTGVEDSTWALNQIAADIKAGGVRKSVRIPFGKYKITSMWTVDVSFVNIFAECAIIDAATVAGRAVKFTASAIENSLPPVGQSTIEIRGLSIEGDKTQPRGVTGTTGIEIDTATSAVANLKMYNVNISHFETDIVLKNHTYIPDFFGCTFSKAITGMWTPAGMTDAGERISLFGCTFGNNTTHILAENPNGSIHASVSSFDYPTGDFFNIKGSQIYLEACHVEGAANAFTGSPIKLSGNGATFVMNGGKLLFGSQTPTYPNLFDIDASTDSARGGGVTLRDVFFFNINPTSGVWVNGDGYIDINNWFSYDSSNISGILTTDPNQNCLMDGSFETASFKDMWFISNDAGVAITNQYVGTKIKLELSTDVAKVGAKSMKITKLGTQGETTQFYLAIPVINPIARYLFSMNYNKRGTGTGNLVLDMKWGFVEKDTAGLPKVRYESPTISNRSITFTTSEVDWSNTVLAPKLRRPKWATHMLIAFSASNLTSNTTVYLDDLIINEM